VAKNGQNIKGLIIYMKTFLNSDWLRAAAIDTPVGKRNSKMKIKAQQMTFRQDITKI
jgi:hypothetical protein